MSVAVIEDLARKKGLAVVSASEQKVGHARPIPAIVLVTAEGSACFPLITTDSPEWQAHNAAAERVAALWKRVEWFSPLWVAQGKLDELLRAIEHRSGADALQHFDYHLSTEYNLGFQAVCIAQLLPKSRTLAVFAPLAREAYLAFYSGHRASSVAALIPVIEGGLQRIATTMPNLDPKSAIDHTVGSACSLAAQLYFDGLWVPDGYRSKEFLFGLDERVFVFETFRRWIKEAFFENLAHYSGHTSLNRHLFAHGKSTDWQQPSNFSRLIVAITTLGVIEAWHDKSNAVPLMLPRMDEASTLLWQQALLRVRLQMSLQLQEEAVFHAHGRLVPELPTDDGVTLRKAILSMDGIDDLVHPLRQAGWNVTVTEPDAGANFLIATATATEPNGTKHVLSVALLYTCASDNALYRKLAEQVDVILFRGAPYRQASYATGIELHVGPVRGWQPPRAPGHVATRPVEGTGGPST